MSQTKLREVGLSAYGRADSLFITKGFVSTATRDRQTAIERVVALHGIDLANVKSFTYVPALRGEGQCVAGHVRIGPRGFDQDRPWLAAVILHEAVHADQFAFYASHGVHFKSEQVRSEAQRKVIALDEFEAFYVLWRNHRMLGLSAPQAATVQRDVRLWLIEIDDAKLQALARQGKIEEARRVAIRELPRN